MVNRFTKTVDGFTSYGLESEAVAIEVVPELGAKIRSIVNRRTGREWMWSPPDRGSLFRNQLGDAFEHSTLIGADECIPTMEPCEWQGRKLPDHGEAWSMPWTVDAAALAQNRIVTSLRLPISPLAVERSIALEDDCVTIDYQVTNLADEATDYLWAHHPLIPIEEGDRLEPTFIDFPLCMSEWTFNIEWEGRGYALQWPIPYQSKVIRFDKMELATDGPAAIKLFSLRSQVPEAAIRNIITGDSIVYRADPQVLGALGIWINRGGWHGYHHVAIEFGNAAPDPLDIAVTGWERYQRLEPGASQTWQMKIIVGRSA